MPMMALLFVTVKMHNRIICLLCIFILIYVKSSMGLSGEQEDCPNRNDFRCKNGDCIDFKKECNGVADCTDESDELDCCKFLRREKNTRGFSWNSKVIVCPIVFSSK